MDPRALIGHPSPLGYPAPYWFIALFKVLGFVLHMVPMNLWFAGTILVVLLRGRGEDAGRLSDRLLGQMPIIVALGVNFGIVPLLFTQVAYYRVFYPATILMAWPWFAIVVLLTFAYYGVYLYAAGLKRGGPGMTRLRRASGWASALLFIAISFLFANGFSLMTNLQAWPRLWEATSVAGAPVGLGLNVADASLWPRWLMMFGLAVTTTAAYIAVDAGLFAVREGEAYKRWAGGFAWKMYAAGLIWFALAGSWYVFGTWQEDVRQVMFSGPWATLTILTALGPGLVLVILALQRRGVTPSLAFTAGLAQVGILALNAVSRQMVQNLELRPFLDVTRETVNIQWSPLVIFLALFVAGLLLIGWMVGKVAAAERRGVSLGG